MADLCNQLGCDTVAMHCEWDNTFPNHPPDPTRPQNMVELGAKVVETGAEFGIGIDGDGDRVGVVDENGNFIHEEMAPAPEPPDETAPSPTASGPVEFRLPDLGEKNISSQDYRKLLSLHQDCFEEVRRRNLRNYWLQSFASDRNPGGCRKNNIYRFFS